MFPEVGAQPRAAQEPIGPPRIALASPDRRSLAPDVRIVMRNPATGPIILTSGFVTIVRQVLDQPEKGLVTLGEVGQLRRPIVHLGINIERIVGTPGRGHRFIPDTLQGGGDTPGARTRDQQVASVVEKQRGQRRIITAFRKPDQTLLSAQYVRCGGIAKVKRYPMKEFLVVGKVTCAEFFRGKLFRCVKRTQCYRHGIAPLATR